MLISMNELNIILHTKLAERPFYPLKAVFDDFSLIAKCDTRDQILKYLNLFRRGRLGCPFPG